MSNRQGRLLIIEDETELNNMLKTYFEMQGYEVYQAHTGTDGVQLARRKLPNLVLLDIRLPDINGFDVCKTLRTTNRTRYIPITFLTEKDSRNDKVEGLGLGADDYITKPFDLEELRLRVKRSMQRATSDSLTDPRTGLPGRPLVVERVTEAAESDTGWKYLDASIKDMKPFSERYGFVAADEVMSFTARVLSDGLEDHGTAQDFIGHLRDTTFAIITYLEDPTDFIQTVEEQFDNGICMFYSFAEREAGAITYEDAEGNLQEAPLMALDLQVAQPPPDICEEAGC